MSKKLGLLNRVIYWVNIIAALLLFVSFILPYIPPKKFPNLSLLSLAVSPLIVINILFVAYWLFKLKKFVLLSLTAIVIAYFHFGSFFKFSSTNNPTEITNTLNILSFNVRLFNLYETKDTQKNIPEIISSFIKKENPDVLCLQEYNKKIKIDFSEYPYRYIHFRGKNILGHAIFSKYPLINTYSFDFEDSYNNTLSADLLKGSDTLRIYNFHLESLSIKPSVSYLQEVDNEILRKKISTRFIKQQEQVETILEHKNNSRYPVIISGDFNNTPFSYVYHKVSESMNDAFVEAGNGIGTTYLFEYYPMRIDYILASNELQILSFNTIKKTFSDHYPIIATIGWD
ncbi:MAG: endonuclease/exonuclease/phosphatase family protein [Flavobacteriales bacterium]|jgi:endonuclease/exonuclease/phosphatase family metal-dependent hydrolase